VNIRSAYEKTAIIEEFVAVAAFLVLFVTVLIQVVFRVPLVIRTIPYAPIWTEELSRWLFVYVVFFGASRGVHSRDYIMIDTVVKKLPKRVQQWIQIFVDIIMLVAVFMVIFVAFRGMPFVARQRATTLPVTLLYLYGVLPVTFIIMAFRISVSTIGDIVIIFSNQEEAV
jgi:TRAP-type C4-dicarboxylate transport system permease small subunit